MSTIFTVGDYGTKLQINAKKDDGTAFPLTGCTVTGILVKADNTKRNVSCTIDDAVNGIASYTTTIQDTDVAGACLLYVKVVGASFQVTFEDVIDYEVLPVAGGV